MVHKKDRLRITLSTPRQSDFKDMARFFPERVRIVAEGDSWFSFPKKALVAGAPSNILAHLCDTKGPIGRRLRRRASILRLSSNGDEVVEIAAGDQRHGLCKLLESYADRGDPVDLLLLSGGGNDVAGRFRLDRVLKRDASGATGAEQCFDKTRLSRRMKQVELAYREFIDMRDRYSPSTRLVVHTYDYPFPDGRKARFLKVIRSGPWLEPYLIAAGVRPALRRPACRYLIDRLAQVLQSLSSPSFVVADTRKTLAEHGLWNDELHPTSRGFLKIARKYYAGMRKALPELPPLS